MRKLSVLAAAIAVAGLASTTFAAKRTTMKVKPVLMDFDKTKFVTHVSHVQPPPPPAPGSGTIQPIPSGPAVGGPVVGHPGAMVLYHGVKVKDRKNIHPCAVPKVVKIIDPCWKPQHCGCCAPARPRCVYVKICVPPCACERVKVSRDGRKVKYDYGEYQVELESKDGVVEVDYDD